MWYINEALRTWQLDLTQVLQNLLLYPIYWIVETSCVDNLNKYSAYSPRYSSLCWFSMQMYKQQSVTIIACKILN